MNYKRSPICDELERLNLSEKSDLPADNAVKSITEEAIVQIEDKLSKIDSIHEKTDTDEPLATAYEEFKENISNLQSMSGTISEEQLEAVKSARNAGKKLMRQASQSLFNLLTQETTNSEQAEEAESSNRSNFNKAKEMFERLSDPENSPTNSPEPQLLATKITTRPQSSKPKPKSRKQDDELARRARLGCNVCYISRSETDLTLWNYEADMKSNENETSVKIRPKPKKNIYMDLFKEIKELISEVSRLDHAITQESQARKDIETKYAYLLEK